MFDELVKRPVAGLLTVAGTVLLTPVVLSALARITRPLTKAMVQVYFDLMNEVREEMAEYQSYKRRRKHPGALAAHALSEGAQGLLVGGTEIEAEESATETIIEALVEVFE
jgi:hypothetical protein